MDRIVIVQEHLPHYRQRFYELLHANLADNGIKLDLIYSPRLAANLLAGSLPWATPIPIQKIKSLAWQNVFPICRGADLVIVQQESKYLANFLLQFLSIFKKQKVAYWGHGRNFQSENASIAGERVKQLASLYCDWWFAYNDLSVEIVKKLGFPSERITSVQNSIDTRLLSDVRKSISPSTLDTLRTELDIQSKNVCVFTGGLYREKRLPFLIEAGQAIRREIPDFELIIIGKGPEADFIKRSAATHPWIHFVGPKSDIEKVPYWMLSKVLLMPGLVGLVILDSFALGIPMITTDYPYHSPEISYLKNGVNGLVVTPWPDVAEFARRTVKLLRNPGEIQKLSTNALAAGQEYSVERMAENFSRGVVQALAVKKTSRFSTLKRQLIQRESPQSTPRLGIILRSLTPYLRDFYDCLPGDDHIITKLFIGQRGTDWINPWDTTLMNLRRADHVYVNAKTQGRLMRTIFPTKKLFAALERFSPNILITNEYSPLSIAAALWAAAHRIPWIIATDIGLDYKAPYPRLKLSQKITHTVANHFCHGILALTPSAAKRARKLGKQYLLCPHAIDTSVYKPPLLRPHTETVNIISVGNFISRKGYDLLLKSLHLLSKKMPTGWRLNCYGAGAHIELSQLANELNLGTKVRFSAFLGVEELVSAYQQSDIFVSASRSDTYGVVVHEAAACGLPLIVSQHCGAAEVLVEHNRNGYIVNPADSETFSDFLFRLISDEKQRIQFGLHSRQLAEAHDVHRNATNMLEWLTNFTKSKSHE